MTTTGITSSDGGFALQGLPENSKRIIKIEDYDAQRLADYSLHKVDLEFAEECLDALINVSGCPPVVTEALWRSAIVHVMKCFGDNRARGPLPEDQVLKGLPPEARLVFDYFKNLRNKTIAHDENSWTQCHVGAAINDGTHQYKVEEVFAITFSVETLNDSDFHNLKALIAAANIFNNRKLDELNDAIRLKLEGMSFEELSTHEGLQYRVPSIEEVSGRRPRTGKQKKPNS